MFTDLNNVFNALGVFNSPVIITIRSLLMWPWKRTDWLKLELSELVKVLAGRGKPQSFSVDINITAALPSG